MNKNNNRTLIEWIEEYHKGKFKTSYQYIQSGYHYSDAIEAYNHFSSLGYIVTYEDGFSGKSSIIVIQHKTT